MFDEDIRPHKYNAKLIDSYKYSMAYVERNIERIPESGCWIWMGYLSKTGYAGGRVLGEKIGRIYRWLYIKINGDIGKLALDHLCRVRCCVNPAHLEPVTLGENVLRGISFAAVNKRKTHCPNGHAYDLFRINSQGKLLRNCRACVAQKQKGYYRAKRSSIEKARKPC